MRKSKIFLSAMLTVVITLLTTACNDDLDNLHNTNPKLEQVDNYKISSFVVANSMLELADTVTGINVHLRSKTDGTEHIFYASRTAKNDAQNEFKMRIPVDVTLADGDYRLLFSLLDGTTIRRSLLVAVKEEMVHSIYGAEDGVKYDLDGDGTKDNPYLIESVTDYSRFMKGLRDDTEFHGFGAYFAQTVDLEGISSSGSAMDKGYSSFSFAGNYDGQGHKIKIEYIGNNNTETDCYVGMFPNLIYGATVQNLDIECQIVNAANYVGALAGTSSGMVTIDNVSASGTIIAGSNVGGLIGASGQLGSSVSHRGTKTFLHITNSQNNCVLTCTGDYVGGFVGDSRYGLKAETIETNAAISGRNYVGGLVGSHNPESTSLSTDLLLYNVINNTSTGRTFSVNGASYVGGIAGYCLISDFFQVHNAVLTHTVDIVDSPKVIYGTSDYVGGLFGKLSINSPSGMSISQCATKAPVVGGKYTGGFAGYMEIIGSGSLRLSSHAVTSTIEGCDYTGGIFGYANVGNHLTIGSDNDAMPDCTIYPSNTQAYVRGGDYTGGLFGYLNGDLNIEKYADVKVNVTGGECTGGHVGSLNSSNVSADKLKIDANCKISGHDKTGGFLGEAYNSIIKGGTEVIYNTEKIPATSEFDYHMGAFVDAENYKYIGGIVGFTSECSLEGVACNGTIKGTDYVGGIVGVMDVRKGGAFRNIVSNCSDLNGYGYIGGVTGLIYTQENTTINCIINYTNVSGKGYISGVFGLLKSESKQSISWIVNTGNISGPLCAAGVVGYMSNQDEMITSNCANYGKITGLTPENDGLATSQIGGIIADAPKKKNFVYSCANHGEVYGQDFTEHVGGVVGRIGKNNSKFSEDNNYKVYNCCNTGYVHSDNPNVYAGGVVGYLEEGSSSEEWSLKYCYNTGTVEIPSSHDTDHGGIAGFADAYASVYYSINWGKIKGKGNGCVGSHSGALPWDHGGLYMLKGDESEYGKVWKEKTFNYEDRGNASTYKDIKDFDTYWIIGSDLNDGYPYLKDCYFQFTER